MAEQCQHRKPDGTSCRAFACTGSPYCFTHDPHRAGDRRRAQKKGGRAAHRKVAVLPANTPDAALTSLGEVAAFLAVVVNKTARGEIDSKVANSLGLLCNQLQKCIQASELEMRVAALEEALARKGAT
jgi:hypothetical protein